MIYSSAIKSYVVVWLTLLVGMILTILPLPSWGVWLRPEWVLLIVLFWTIDSQGRIGLGTAWLAGLCLDFLSGTLLGQHALIMVVLTYLTIKIYARVRYFPLYQQMFVILFVVALDILLNRWLVLLSQHSVSSPLCWFAVLTSTLIWPLITALLQDSRPYSLRY